MLGSHGPARHPQLVANKQASVGDGRFPLLDEQRRQANDPNRVDAYIDGHPAGAAGSMPSREPAEAGAGAVVPVRAARPPRLRFFVQVP